MERKVWQHLTLVAPVEDARALLPHEASVGTATLWITGEQGAEAAFWGRGARRYRAIWADGGPDARGYVEMRPHSEHMTEIVVHLEPPRGWHRHLWRRSRLEALARALGEQLRVQIESAHGERLDRTETRGTVSARRSA